jgi:hypothetical protein
MNGGFSFSETQLQRFEELARADLVAERDALMADYNSVSAENEDLRTRLIAMACAQVDREDAPYTHPAPQAVPAGQAELNTLLHEIDTQCGNGMMPWQIEDAYAAYEKTLKVG